VNLYEDDGGEGSEASHGDRAAEAVGCALEGGDGRAAGLKANDAS